MLKSLLSLCSIVVLLVPTLVISNPSHACMVDVPVALLQLYESSDYIYIGTFNRLEDHDVVEGDAEGVTFEVKRHFDISSSLKGETRKSLVLDHTEYRSTPADKEPEGKDSSADEASSDDEETESAPEAAPEDSEGPGYRVYSLKPGDQVLIFLKKGEDEKKAPELADYSDGIKRMTPERLDAYTARIKELNSIFSAKEIDRSKIADWLVRCIEDPITRWEGAYELLRSFRRLDYQKSKNPPAIGNTENKENSGAGAEPEAATDNSAGESVEKPAVVLIDGLPAAAKTIAIDEDVEYAQLVTDQHKQTLLNLVLQQKMVDDTGKHRELKSGDAELIEIVSRWGDNRLAKYLLDVLPAMSDDVYTSSDLMDTVAEIIKDDELEKIAEDYSDVRYKENEELVEMDDAESKEADAAANKAESSDGAKPEGGTSNVKDEEPKEPEAPKMTYKDLRRNLMEKYMQRSVVALALAESRQMEKERASR